MCRSKSHTSYACPSTGKKPRVEKSQTKPCLNLKNSTSHFNSKNQICNKSITFCSKGDDKPIHPALNKVLQKFRLFFGGKGIAVELLTELQQGDGLAILKSGAGA